MIKIENVQTWGIEHAVRAARNPLSSWSKSDSGYVASGEHYEDVDYVVGPNDLDLMKRLVKAGVEHRKCLRMIHVSMDITSNHTFWSQFDTYKVGVIRNSCSKMHSIHKRDFVLDDFTHEYTDKISLIEEHVLRTIGILNALREKYNETGDRMYWRAMIDILPMGYNLKATVDMNYENVLNIIHQRTGHKLSEWETLIEELKKLPYVEELLND